MSKNAFQTAAGTLSDAIQSNASFAFFDLGLQQQEITSFEETKTGNGGTYDNFADMENLRTQVRDFIQSLGNTDGHSEWVAQKVDEICGNIIAEYGAEAAWITIRAFPPMDAYNVPRWHTDGRFFDGATQEHKIAISLAGPSTLLSELPDTLRPSFNNLTQALALEQMSIGAREQVADFIGTSGIQQAGAGQGLLFKVGSPDAAIHSEPPISAARLFISIVPGTREQILALQTRFNTPAVAKPVRLE